jgi:hypothetical protein
MEVGGGEGGKKRVVEGEEGEVGGEVLQMN